MGGDIDSICMGSRTINAEKRTHFTSDRAFMFTDRINISYVLPSYISENIAPNRHQLISDVDIRPIQLITLFEYWGLLMHYRRDCVCRLMAIVWYK